MFFWYIPPPVALKMKVSRFMFLHHQEFRHTHTRNFLLLKKSCRLFEVDYKVFYLISATALLFLGILLWYYVYVSASSCCHLTCCPLLLCSYCLWHGGVIQVFSIFTLLFRIIINSAINRLLSIPTPTVQPSLSLLSVRCTKSVPPRGTNVWYWNFYTSELRDIILFINLKANFSSDRLHTRITTFISI